MTELSVACQTYIFFKIYLYISFNTVIFFGLMEVSTPKTEGKLNVISFPSVFGVDLHQLKKILQQFLIILFRRF